MASARKNMRSASSKLPYFYEGQKRHARRTVQGKLCTRCQGFASTFAVKTSDMIPRGHRSGIDLRGKNTTPVVGGICWPQQAEKETN